MFFFGLSGGNVGFPFFTRRELASLNDFMILCTVSEIPLFVVTWHQRNAIIEGL